jgi:beta-glucosidase
MRIDWNLIKAVLIFYLAFGLEVLSAQPIKYRDPNQPTETRVNDLISRLTVEEKISLLGYKSKPVPRLGIPAYNWWNEALHGVARAGKATVFPQAIAMAATFNDQLIGQVADAISTEARAKYNLATQLDRRIQYMGLTFWSPNINIFRDPRWGRGQETYGEDPFLTSKMGMAFVRGMQGNDPKYLKTAACAKHYAVHSGPEATRHSFNAVVDEKDLRETYLYAFQKLVVDAHVESIMCAYNRLNGQPCCSNETLLRNILRKEWKFKGHVVTDCWALDDIYKGHKVLKTSVEVAAAALKSGINLDCSELLQRDLLEAYRSKLVTDKDINTALAGLLRTQIKLGFFDDNSQNPYRNLGANAVHSAEHVALSRKVAQQSMVLLKNANGLLPLKSNKYRSMVVIGPNAGNIGPLAANYHGVSGDMVTFIEGISEAAGPATVVQYEQGSDYSDTTRFGGIWAASESDLTIAVIGLTPVLEGEEHDAFLSPSGGDKADLSLPAPHIALLKKLQANKKPVIAVVTAGSAVDIAAIEPYADAIVLAWYSGEQGGNAFADILFGKVSPSGRLPVTFYKSLKDLPDCSSYALNGRTYRYFRGDVQYPFGFGLSYSTFNYQWDKTPQDLGSKTDSIRFAVTVTNTGAMAADEVIQVYVSYPTIDRMPLKELKAFKRIAINSNASQTVAFAIPVNELRKWDLKAGDWKLYAGTYTITVGSHSADARLRQEFSLK